MGTYSRGSRIKVYDLHALQRLREAVMNYDLRFLAGLTEGKLGHFQTEVTESSYFLKPLDPASVAE
jgi:hypothetical protein